MTARTHPANARLADALSEDVLSTSEAELLAEVAEDYGDNLTLTAKFDAVLARTTGQVTDLQISRFPLEQARFQSSRRVRSPGEAKTRLWDNLKFWRSFSMGAASLATACLAAFVFSAVLTSSPFQEKSPIKSATTPSTQLVATLNETDGRPRFVVAASSERTSLAVIAVSTLTPGDGRALKLFVGGPGEGLRLLGSIQPGNSPARIELPADLVAYIRPAAILSVRLDDADGTGRSGLLVASGQFVEL
jgi:anti-sigma-K factor RskA